MTTRITHWFLPHRKNRYRSPLLQLTGLFAVILLAVGFQVSLNLFTSRYPAVLGVTSNITADQIFSRTNSVREKNGRLPLKLNSELNQAALAKASDMINHDYWSHTTPSGRQPWDFIIDAGYSYTFAGENLARNFTNNQAVIDAWLASPTHRDNLLNPNYQDIGIAVVEGQMAGHSTVLIVQMFGAQETSSTKAVAAVSSSRTRQINSLPALTPVSPETPLQAPIVPVALVSASNLSSPPIPASPFALAKLFALVVLGLLLVVASFDYLTISRHRLNLAVGHTFLHALFLGTIFIMVYLTVQGAVL